MPDRNKAKAARNDQHLCEHPYESVFHNIMRSWTYLC